jgi:dihydrolipoamide dehydrogenase
MIHEAAALVTRGATVQELLEVVHGHPTLSEAVYEAAEDVFGQPIHRPMKRAGSRTASPDR